MLQATQNSRFVAVAPRNSNKLPYLRSHSRATRVTAAKQDSNTSSGSKSSTPVDTTSITTATQAVEKGLQLFQSGDSQGALRLFLLGQKLTPNPDEARAALYNAACAYTKLQRWQEATDSVVKAVNAYDLKLAVALRDPDLAPLREKREWIAALDGMAGGVTNDAYVKLRAEAKSPFRLVRLFLFGGLGAGASLGLLISFARIISALQGGEGAPELQETAFNLSINGAGVVVLGFLLIRDLEGQRKEKEVVEREEALATLQVTIGSNKVLPLAAFRGTARLVIMAGSKGQVARAVAAAQPFKEELRERGVSLVPVVLSADDLDEKMRRLKAELADNNGEATSGTVAGGSGTAGGARAHGFGGSAAATKTKAPKLSSSSAPAVASAKDRKWQLEPYALPEWEAWVKDQTKGSAVGAGVENCIYVQVQLDGSVRASGVGIPPWKQFLGDIPEIDSVRTKFTDGMGMQ